MFRKVWFFVIAIGVLSLAIGACSSSDDGDGAGGSGGQPGAAGSGGSGGAVNEGGSGGGSNDGGSGGAANEGGSGGEAGAGGGDPTDPWAGMSCAAIGKAFEPCGGDLVGTWDLVGACKENQIGEDFDCPEFSGGVTIQYSSGYSITFTEGELSLPATTRTLALHASMPFSCVEQLGEMGEVESCVELSGPESGTCSGDEVCTCEGEDVLPVEASMQGYAATENGALDLQEDGSYHFCVQGTSLYVIGRGLGEGGDGDSYLHRFTRR